MAAKSRREARDELRPALQSAVSCVSRAVLNPGRAAPGATPFWTFRERFVPLQGSPPLVFSVLHRYELRQRSGASGEWTATSWGYAYHVRERTDREVIRFEWHALGHQVRYPHLHVEGQAGEVRIEAKHHVPTGFVELGMVVRYLIDELGVTPLRGDWRWSVGDAGEQPDEQR